MRSAIRPALIVAASLAATTAALGGPVAAVAANPDGDAPVVQVKLKKLARGADQALPHVQGRTLVDGDIRVTLPRQGSYLGSAGEDHIVLTRKPNRTVDVRRVTDAGVQTVLITGRNLWDTSLSEDGGSLIEVRANRDRSTLVVRDTTNGAQVASRTLPVGWANVVGADETRVIVGAMSGGKGATGTWRWKWQSDKVRKLSGRAAYRADLGADRVAVFTKDPYQNGCSVLSPLSSMATEVWRSCEERIETISPDGSRISTVDLLSDGLGPGVISVRNGKGRLKAAYAAPLVFGNVRWESANTFVVTTMSSTQQAEVRCQATTCERASDLRPFSVRAALAQRQPR